MVKAVWNGKVVAESEETVVVEGNHYFPRDAVNAGYLRDSELYSVCPWKGQASYHTLEVDGKLNVDAAWYYPQTTTQAKPIEGRIAFWRGVTIGGIASHKASRRRREAPASSASSEHPGAC
ncbi:DUF427 domain-containing protein [Pseudarthrobacter sulfonivorans]|uniref:DUF427 domain-containing protein n=1 Tax=Pseudarthrobacter sulfonivorans TaxID=121292 RepID=UPI00168B80DE|nr:DUF427 domain-containing protein [Pseudarthrobacter sulfonivorans]